MAITSPSCLFPPSQLARALASGAAGSASTGDVDFQLDIVNQIIPAIDSGLFTCTVSTSGFAALDIQIEMKTLIDLGYTISLSGSTLTINW